MRSTSDLTKELFDRRDSGGYSYAAIVSYLERDELATMGFIKASDGYAVVLDKINQCVRDGGHLLGIIWGTPTAVAGVISLSSSVYPEYQSYEWAQKGLELAKATLEKDVPGVMPIRGSDHY